MSLIEKAGATVLKGSFDRKSKKNAAPSQNLTAIGNDASPVEPRMRAPYTLDFAALAKEGIYNPEERSGQLALELRAVKRSSSAPHRLSARLGRTPSLPQAGPASQSHSHHLHPCGRRQDLHGDQSCTQPRI